MSNRLHRFTLVVFLGVMATFASAPCYGFRNDFDKSYPLQPGGSFELQNVNGTVEVQGWEKNEVQIHAVKLAKTDRADLSRVSIQVEAKSDSVSVTTNYPQDEGAEVAVDYKILVPHSARVQQIGTINGSIRVSGVDFPGDLRTVNGDVEVYEGGGAIHARTTNGNIHLELARMEKSDEIAAECTNGGVLLAVPPDAGAQIVARSLNGDFSSELPLTLESSLRPREIRGKLGAGGGSIHLRTVNGVIRVVLLRSSV